MANFKTVSVKHKRTGEIKEIKENVLGAMHIFANYELLAEKPSPKPKPIAKKKTKKAKKSTKK